MTIRDLKKWLVEELEQAKEEASESAREFHNSYGAGYDAGFYNALERVRLKLNDQLDT